MNYVVINPMLKQETRFEHTERGWVSRLYTIRIHGLISNHSILTYLRLNRRL